MYSPLIEYALLKNNTVLMIRFTGGYDGADADNASLAIIKHLGVEQGRCIKTVIMDLEQVDAMTLRDTDAARRGLYFHHLSKALNLAIPVPEYLAQIDIFAVEPTQAHVRDVYRDRLRRVSQFRQAANLKFIPKSAVTLTLIQAGVPEDEIANSCWLPLDIDGISSP